MRLWGRAVTALIKAERSSNALMILARWTCYNTFLMGMTENLLYPTELGCWTNKHFKVNVDKNTLNVLVDYYPSILSSRDHEDQMGGGGVLCVLYTAFIWMWHPLVDVQSGQGGLATSGSQSPTACSFFQLDPWQHSPPIIFCSKIFCFCFDCK